jgi:hypothetical protein
MKLPTEVSPPLPKGMNWTKMFRYYSKVLNKRGVQITTHVGNNLEI